MTPVISAGDLVGDQPSIFRALSGYPFLPCPICADDGYPNATESCDHTVLERARRTHPGLVIRVRSSLNQDGGKP